MNKTDLEALQHLGYLDKKLDLNKVQIEVNGFWIEQYELMIKSLNDANSDSNL